MKISTSQKSYGLISAVLLLLIITNPSISDFKAYRGVNTYKGLNRKYNFFLFSVYHQDKDYIGLVGNFVGRENKVNKDSIAYEDTLKKDTAEIIPPLPKGFTEVSSNKDSHPLPKGLTRVN